MVTRLLFKLLSGYDNYQLFPDAHRYDILSDRILSGNYDLDIIAYITAPLYCYILAFIKLLFSELWEPVAVAYQFILISISAVYIYKIAKLLFGSTTTGIIAALLYIFYPLTLWLNFTFTQETSFQGYFIFFLFHFIHYQKTFNIRSLIYACIFFCISLLTKSHILMLLPFIVCILLYKKKVKDIIIFLAVLMVFVLPHGLLNKKLHDVFTISSHGNASLFILGHSDQTYDCLIRRAGEMEKFSSQGCNPDFVFNTEYEYPNVGLVNQWSAKERNSKRLELAIDWIKSNPDKFIRLKLIGLQRFLMPGLDHRQYRFSYWLLSFIAGLLIYIPAYLTIYKYFRKEPYLHLLVISVIIICGSIFMIFFPINRFRVITMEPLLMVYAGVFYTSIYEKYLKRSKE